MHRAILVLDVEKFSGRTDSDLLAVRRGMYKALTQAFARTSIDLRRCIREDAGDGVLVLVPPDTPKSLLVTKVVPRLVAALGRHNATCGAQTRIRLRAALDAGEVHSDSHGVTSHAINHAFRLTEAPALKSALSAASSAVLGVIVSAGFYDDVVRHDPAAEASMYRPVRVAVKETKTTAWMRLFDGGDAVAPDGQAANGSGRRPVLSAPVAELGSLTSERPPDRDPGTAESPVAAGPVAAGPDAAGPDAAGPVAGGPGAGRGASEPRSPSPRPATGLPPDIGAFTGRDAELAELQALVTSRTSSALVICVIRGSPGAGKTALAVHFGHRAAAQFPDGQLYVNLHGSDPPPLPPHGAAFSQLLGALAVDPAQIPADPAEQARLYRSQLAGRRMLVVLDDVATADDVRPLVTGSPDCVVLVTSRHRLGELTAVEAAHRVTVDLTLDRLTRQESEALLERVAGTARISSDREAAAELTRLCGGLPLALRLAAACLVADPSLTLAGLAAGLRAERDRTDPRPAHGDYAAEARLVLARSCHTLTPKAGRLFRLLSLPAGADVSAAAAAALADTTAGQARHLLNALTKAQLVEQIGADRYRLPEPMRRYADERAGADEPEAVRQAAIRRLLVWYLRTADAAARVLDSRRGPVPPDAVGTDAVGTDAVGTDAVGTDAVGTGAVGTGAVRAVRQPLPFTSRVQARRWCEAERANLVAAVRQAAKLAEYAVACQLATAIHGIFDVRGHGADQLAVLSIGRTSARRIGDWSGEARMLDRLGDVCCDLQRLDEALGRYQEAAVIRREHGALDGEEAGSPHGEGPGADVSRRGAKRIPPRRRLRARVLLTAALVVVLLIGALAGARWYVARSCGSGVQRAGPAGQCVGVTDGSVIFAAYLKSVEQKIRAENAWVTGAHKPFVSIGYLIPMTVTAADSESQDAVRHQLEGAYLGQYEANHSAADGKGPLIRLLLANDGSQAAYWAPVVKELEQRQGSPDHVVAVAGLGPSIQNTVNAVTQLGAIGIPIVGATITGNNLEDYPGLVRVAPSNTDEVATA